MQSLTLFVIGFGFLVLWRVLAGLGYPEQVSVIAAATVVLTLASLHAFLSRGDARLHPATVILALVMTALVLAGFVVLLSTLNPLALPVLIVGLGVPVMLYSRRQRIKRQWIESGCCETCGYDLRASPERCPECNTPIPEDRLRLLRIRAEMAAARAQATPHTLPPPPLPPDPPVQ